MRSRIVQFSIIIGIFTLVWVCYLFTVQILNPYDFQRTIDLRKNPSKIIIPSKRGNIYDRNMEILVSSMKYYQIDLDLRSLRDYAERNNIEDLNPTYDTIAEVIAANSEYTARQIRNKIRKHENYNSLCLDSNVSDTELNNIKSGFEKDTFTGLVSSYNRSSRVYTKDKLCSRFLGFVKNSTNDADPALSNLYGASGVESSYNNHLTGKYGWMETIQDANNKRIPFLYLKKRPETNGNSLVLTIDLDIQEILHENLNKGLKKYKAKNAIGIIMKPDTGEILAMSSINKQDDNLSAAEIRAQSNMAISFQFEPGSVIKPITALLAVEKKLFKENELIDCRDYHIEYNSGVRIIKDDHDLDKLTLRNIIAKSSNVGISKIVERIGSETLHDRMFEFGFGHPTGIDLAGEKGGIFRKLKYWQGFSLHSISFGQEMSSTALQLANAYCSFANGGKILQPYIVKEIRNEQNETLYNAKPKVLRKISDEKSLEKLKEYLQAVVDDGTANATKMEYITVAGKTGTAEKKIEGQVGYSKDKYTSVFAGFFPVDNPEYVMVIVYDEPEYSNMSYYASLSAVPTFRNILEDLLNLPKIDLTLNVKKSKQTFIFAPDLRNIPGKEAVALLEKMGIAYCIIGNSGEIVINQYPSPNTSFNKNEKVILVLNKPVDDVKETISDYLMPNLQGLTLRKALALANKKSVRLAMSGSGVIISQSIVAGAKINYGEKCRVVAR